jgi:hypothetical protein
MQKLILALHLGLGFVLSNAQAQNCATPLHIASVHTPIHYTGDTCAADNPLPTYGGTGSPQNEVVYSFVALGPTGSFSIAGTGGYAGTTPTIFLFPACSAATDPIAFGVPGTEMVVGSLTDGQTYYVAVTADPGGANSGCGTYDLVASSLPVTLTSFSIE